MPGDKCEEGKSRIKERLNKSCLHLSELNMSNVSHCERNTTRNGLLPPKIDQEHLGDN